MTFKLPPETAHFSTRMAIGSRVIARLSAVVAGTSPTVGEYGVVFSCRQGVVWRNCLEVVGRMRALSQTKP